jgi:GT2 family glycosyltransferase
MSADVSVIVVNYRTEEMTASAVHRACAAASPFSAEAIVVDNGATAASAAALHSTLPDALIVSEPENRGFAAGVNAGLTRASGRYAFLLNSDAFVRDDGVARLIRYLDAHPTAGVVAPRLVGADGTAQLNAYRRFPNLATLFFDLCLPLHPLHGTALHPHTVPRRRLDGPRRVAHVMGAAMMVRAQAAAQAGALDEAYFLYLEETEWQRRIARAGWEIHFEPAAVAVHLEKGSSDAQVVSPHYLASAQRYFQPAARARAVMRAGAWISLISAVAAKRLRPRDPRFAKLATAYRRTLGEL